MKNLTMIFLGLFYTITGLNATVWYVKSDGMAANNAENARSWDTACSDLQAVINNSTAGDEIWVAAGTYKPNRKANDLYLIDEGNQDNAFVLKGDVKMYGGFPSNVIDETESRTNPRNPHANKTILSGNINKDKKSAYHVVIAVSNRDEILHLDGFTITGGAACGKGSIYVNGLEVERHAGGGIAAIAHNNSHIILAGNTFTNNVASYGGGVSTITSSNFTDAFGKKRPGAVFIRISTTASLAEAGNINVIGNLFENNSAEYGGGIYTFTGGNTVILARNMLSNNKADFGGGIYAATLLRGEITIFGNSISNNSANINGGGLSVGTYYGGNIVLDNDDITRNSALGKGAGIFVRSEIGSVSIFNSIIKDNINSRNVASVLRYDGTLNISDCQIGDSDLPEGTTSNRNRLADNEKSRID
jgi:hypothetical protein